VTVPSVTALVIGVRALGLLQPLEFPFLDQFFLLRPQESIDSRILIVEITEADVQRVGRWPMADETLTRLLSNLLQHQPVAIGLDLYRDLPVEPGHQSLIQLFQTTPNLIGVQKVAASADSSAVAPPPFLKQKGQVGANDLVLDADGKIRRGLFYLADPEGENVFSFSLMLADQYLQRRDIQTTQTSENLIQSGSVVFPLLHPDDGSYVRARMDGYQVMLNYRGMMDRFSTVTMSEVLDQRVRVDQVKDKIVLIGATAESLKDLFYVPYSGTLGAPRRMAGVTIHANLVSQILSAVLDGRSPVLMTWSEPLDWLWIFLWAAIGATISWKARYNNRPLQRLQTTLSIFLAAGLLVGGTYLAFLQSWWIPLVPPLMALAGAALAITGYVARSAADMRRTFGRYLTDEVVASLLETPSGLSLGGERRKVTIMITDLRGFSAISEWLPPEQVVTILNHYLGIMSDIVTQYNGTINEFIGDGIFIMFGAPVYREDDSQRAIACAVALQAAMTQVNDYNRQSGFPPIEMGIGINTGEVVVGNVGSQKRAKYTVTGNHVNLAARVESYTVGRQILISEYTYQDADPSILQIDGQMQVEPKGIKEPITLYDISGVAGRFNVFLPELTEILVTPNPPIAVRFTVLEGKHVVGTMFAGAIVRLSDQGGELLTEHVLTPLSNLKLNLLLPDAPQLAEADVYAKVLVKQAATVGCVRIRFTGMPPEATAALERIRR